MPPPGLGFSYQDEERLGAGLETHSLADRRVEVNEKTRKKRRHMMEVEREREKKRKVDIIMNDASVCCRL